jgi:ABC transporter substrate binding protein
LLASTIVKRMPSLSAAPCNSFTWVAAPAGLAALISIPIDLAAGMNSCRNSRRFGAISSLMLSDAGHIAARATRTKIPTIYPWLEFTAAGGLMNYGASIPDAFRQVGVYTGQILKGARPADLPVQRPTRLRFVINLKAAKALGLTIPETLLATADEVIQGAIQPVEDRPK